jgi:cyclic beta-1,2-glucan synthetase
MVKPTHAIVAIYSSTDGVSPDVLRNLKRRRPAQIFVLRPSDASSHDDPVARRFAALRMPDESVVVVTATAQSAGGVVTDFLREGSAAVYRLRCGAPGEVYPSDDRGLLVWERLRAVQHILDESRSSLADALQLEHSLTPAAEWLLDNAYLIRTQIAEVKRHLPENHARLLRRDAAGIRVYALARTLARKSDYSVDAGAITEYLKECQTEHPLTLAELWFFPLFLRIAVIEGIAEQTLPIVQTQDLREASYFWANRLAAFSRQDSDDMQPALGELKNEAYARDPAFVTALTEQLHEEDSALTTVQHWIEEEFRSPLIDLVRQEHAREAAQRVSTANAFGSLRALSRIDYRDIFEASSVVEAELRKDPGGIYPSSDFITRDRCRTEVERISRSANLEERDVALLALRLAVSAGGPRTGHVAYYLVAEGVAELEEAAKARVSLRMRTIRAIRQHATGMYLGGLLALTSCLLILSLRLAWDMGMTRTAPLCLLGVLALFPLSELAIQIINALVVSVLRPDSLPKLDFRAGIPPEHATLAVVPMMLVNVELVCREVEKLEVRYLANRDANLSFALLTDFIDTDTETTSGDEAVLSAAREGIENLRTRYPHANFLLFHRPREWSQSEGCWIGRERKRGKLEDLNEYLSGAGSPGILQAGKLDGPIRFVITLDADTQLPPGTARRLIETIAHPLNLAEIDPVTRVCRKGYAIIQPRVSIALPGATATRFTRIFADANGTDPYCQSVSDVHQDLFGEATFHGKAIYDVQAFRLATGDRFPAETILSHDLIEGAHAGVGLATDVELFENMPLDYGGYIRREHRWIRGDWQILPWIFPRVPNSSGGFERNPLSLINRWRIFDNLRRSLVPVASLLLLLLGWFISAAPGVWSLVIACAVVIPALAPLLDRLALRLRGTVRRWQGAETELLRAAVLLAFLPYQAWVTMDAIVRVGYRACFSRRRLLEWKTADAAGEANPDTLRGIFRQMLILSGFSAALVLGQYAEGRFAPAAMFLALWIVAPGVLRYLALPATADQDGYLDPAGKRYLRSAARRTWRYFDDLVNADSSWLPPDNSQVALHIEVAQRTSPTNIGLWLTSALAACDLGYLTVDEFVRRCELTMATLRRLEKYEGHLLNWYNTSSLEPLTPSYVSTVDSGNLLASLWVLQQGCVDLTDRPLVGAACLRGLTDTLSILRQVGGPDRAVSSSIHSLRGLLRGKVEDHRVLDRLDLAAPVLQHVIDARRWHDTGDESSYWVGRMTHELTSWTETSHNYLRWMQTLTQPPDSVLTDLGSEAVALRQEALRSVVSLHDLAAEAPPASLAAVEALLARPRPAADSSPLLAWLRQLDEEFGKAKTNAREMVSRLQALAAGCGALAGSMQMGFLYDRDRRLFGVGYAVGNPVRFDSHYDLLASECRLASLVSIAKGDVPLEHWLALGRPRAAVRGNRQALLSWGGTMFEYLMPLLFTRSYDNSLLDYACQEAVREQIEHGREHDIPWGVSESAFSALDGNQVYQYRAFGVPSLALKAGFEDDLVIAPYATMLALLVAPEKSLANLKQLEALQLTGPMGFYESIDFRFENKLDGDAGVPIYAYMAHHQGMSLMALDNALHRDVMRERFHRIVQVRAVESILYERVPISPPETEPSAPLSVHVRPGPGAEAAERAWKEDTAIPRTHIYGNGRYALMVTNAGGGYSRWGDFDLSRWRADSTLDDWGFLLYVRDTKSNVAWSVCRQPIGDPANTGSVRFFADRAEFERRFSGIGTLITATVAAEDDVEVRRLTVTNHGLRKRALEFTTYLELSLSPHRTDTAHPAFAKMFVETESPANGVLVARHRLRAPDDPPVWIAHVLVGATGEIQHETDRLKFLGRNGTTSHPYALDRDLTGSTGNVLDPVFSLRCRLTLEPRDRQELIFLTMAAESREALLALVDKYRRPGAVARVFEMAWTHAQLQFRYLGIGNAAAHRFEELAGYLLYPNARMRAAEERLLHNQLGQTGLWAYGISGDLPMIAVSISESRHLPLLREALLAHTYWRLRGLRADLVVLNQEGPSYDRPLHHQLAKLIEAHSGETGIDHPGGVFLRDWFAMPEEHRNLMVSSASVVLNGWRGNLQRQLAAQGTGQPTSRAVPPPELEQEPSAPLPFLELPYFNGLGGFTSDGHEYAIYLGPGDHTPAPWSNIMANPSFGAMVTESGLGCTWNGNSQENRLTPWRNDPVRDLPSDAFYVRDDETGALWTPTALPIREKEAYRARHGQGYTVFEHNSHGIEQELTVFVPNDANGGDPVRLCRLRLHNGSKRRRALTVTYFAEWVLGSTREDQQLHIRTWYDEPCGALFATQAWNSSFAKQTAFAALNCRAQSWSGDRRSFLGRNGSYDRPRGLGAGPLDNHTGAGLDPAAALQVKLILQPGQTEEVTCLLGQTATPEAARALIERFRSPAAVEQALQATERWWDSVLGTLQVRTPALSTDLLLNRWLLYQTLSCRFFGRSALYQSSGAYGFRDQLQDCLAFVYASPALTRQHILTAAARQFTEGDVQHWWHPQTGVGVRTRCSDDLMWLPYAVAQYVGITGDESILDVEVPFLEARELKPGEVDHVSAPVASAYGKPLWDHCARAIERAWRLGSRGLPLIGAGDWNDGLNRLGIEGRGESVWLAWFFCSVFESFAALAEARPGGQDMASLLRERRSQLGRAVEGACWDGEWYLRGFFDDGAPLGSHVNAEARIDSLAQSWAVLSGAAEPGRAQQAMASADRLLADEQHRLVRLLTPPFDHSQPHPGYIMGYPPGVRENGGQYTHGSLWMAAAWAQLRCGDPAVRLLTLMNPIEASRDPRAAARYRGEPYVLAGDVCGMPGREGQSGWTWYTGSSGWMYRIWIESVLGFQLRGDRLTIRPAIPADWPGFEIRFGYRSATYEITVDRIFSEGTTMEIDGNPAFDATVPLIDDGAIHRIHIRLAAAVQERPKEREIALAK